MVKELLAKLRRSKFMEIGKKGQATWEKYRNVVALCRDETKKAKVHFKLHLTRDVKDNMNCFFKYLSVKRKTRERVGQLPNEVPW